MTLKKSLFYHLSTLGRFWQEKINAHILRWNILFIFLELGLLVIKFNSLPPQVPLYFSLPWGDQRLTSVSSLFLLPSFSILILVLNNFISQILFTTSLLLSRLLVVFSLVFSFLSLISLFQIIILVS